MIPVHKTNLSLTDVHRV